MMAGAVATRLREMGVTLPASPPPQASYAPFAIAGRLIFTAGQIPLRDGAPAYIGKLGREFDISAGQEAARLCAINVLAQAAAALDGELERIVRCVKLVGFVNSMPDFVDQPKVINAASEFLQAALGEAGRHARSAVGVASLPLGVAVEIEAIFEFSPTLPAGA